MSALPITMRQVRPFWGRIAVMESPVDEAQRASGLIVPVGTESDDYKRGVVLHIDEHWPDPHGYKVSEVLPLGTPVYYRGGVRIGDVVILRCEDVLAYEADE